LLLRWHTTECEIWSGEYASLVCRNAVLLSE
jgi:hypothetical protein